MPGAPKSKAQELTGQAPGAHEIIEITEIRDYKVGEYYRNKYYNLNPRTQKRKTAKVYTRPPGKGGGHFIRHLNRYESIGPVISVEEICSDGKIFVNVQVPWGDRKETTAFINATTDDEIWLEIIPQIGRSSNQDIREKALTGQVPGAPIPTQKALTGQVPGAPIPEPEKHPKIRFRQKDIQQDNLQLHLAQQEYDDQQQTHERRRLVLDMIQTLQYPEDITTADIHQAT